MISGPSTSNQAVRLPLQVERGVSKAYPIRLAITIILVLGSLFLVLAAHQLLFHGVNAISNLSIGGKVLSYGILVLSVGLLIINNIKWYLACKQKAQTKLVETESESVKEAFSPVQSTPEKETLIQERTEISQPEIHSPTIAQNDKETLIHEDSISIEPAAEEENTIEIVTEISQPEIHSPTVAQNDKETPTHEGPISIEPAAEENKIEIVGVAPTQTAPEIIDIKGTIYLIDYTSGPIRQDCRFAFSKRLKNLSGEPILIKEEDIYLTIDGILKIRDSRKNVLKLQANGISQSYMFLPSRLFEGVNEGEAISFYYDDLRIELCCKQEIDPDRRGRFEDVLRRIKLDACLKRAQYQWKDDVKGLPQFMNQLVGKPPFSFVNFASDEKKSIQDFGFYEQDQEKSGPYRELSVMAKKTDAVIFNIHKDFNIREIHLIETFGFNNLHQLWIIIPHKPENNKMPQTKAGFIRDTHADRYHPHQPIGDQSDKKTLSTRSFNPFNGDRWPFYFEGQYSLVDLAPGTVPDFSYNGSGYLQMSVIDAQVFEVS